MEFLDIGIAAILGIILGALAVGAFYSSERDMQRVLESTAALPPEVVQLLTALPGTAVVLGRDGNVLRAGADALGWRLCDTERVLNEQLIALVERQRNEGILVEDHITIGRSALRNSSRVDLHVQVAPVAGGHSLVLIEDETEVRRAEQMRRDFVGNVSHELKTPVGAISLLAETIADSADDADAVSYFAGRLQKESRRLTNLVHDLIMLSQLQDGAFTESHRPLPVSDIVNEAIELCGADLSRTNMSVTRTPSDNDIYVMGSRKQLVTAVRNIIDNAIRYSPEGAEIKVSVQRDGDSVALAIIDQGIGIEQHELDRIFERFYRVDTARSRETGGTGLGLSIVKHTVIEHGGQISVWSSPGRGSTFTLTFPITDAPKAEADND